MFVNFVRTPRSTSWALCLDLRSYKFGGSVSQSIPTDLESCPASLFMWDNVVIRWDSISFGKFVSMKTKGNDEAPPNVPFNRTKVVK